MMRALTRLIRSRDGGALVELAVSLPILVAILAGTIDFARVFNMSIALTNAARAGAQYGTAWPARGKDTAGMIAQAQNAGLPGVSATASWSCVCATDTGTFTATSPTANDCSATCPSSGHVVMTVTVTATKRFTTLMSVLPGVPAYIDLVRSATQRVAN